MSKPNRLRRLILAPVRSPPRLKISFTAPLLGYQGAAMCVLRSAEAYGVNPISRGVVAATGSAPSICLTVSPTRDFVMVMTERL
jgi:hypothetical protein